MSPDEARVLNRLRDAAQQWAGALMDRLGARAAS